MTQTKKPNRKITDVLQENTTVKNNYDSFKQGVEYERKRKFKIAWIQSILVMAGISFSMTLAALLAAYWITK